MSSRINGSDKFPHTDADEAFNKLMEEQESADSLPRFAGQVAFKTELAQQVRIDAPMAETAVKLSSGDRLTEAS